MSSSGRSSRPSSVTRSLIWSPDPIATIFYGEPRFTNDIDVVVLLTREKLERLAQDFPAPEYYLDREAAREAVSARRQFNLIQPGSGLKVDIIVVEESAFNQSRFARANRIRPSTDYEASFASAEDVILMKLEYYRQGGSDRHVRDILGVLAVQGGNIDKDYIAKWADILRLESIWKEILDRRDQR